MIRAFVFVTTRSFKNRILSRIARLRQPRYLLSLVAGLVYMWFAFGRHLGKLKRSEGPVDFVIPPTDLGADIASLVILAMMILVWALPEDAGGLTFTEAEIQFLFTAPLTRRQIVLYKIWRQQPQLLFSAILFTFFGLRSGRFVGIWICLVALSIFFTMSSLARARMKVAGINFFVRLPVVLAVALGVGYAFWLEVKRVPVKEAASAVERSDLTQLFGYADSIFHSAFAQTILFIPRFFGRAILPANTTQLIISCAGVAILAFVFLRIAERLNVSFEEGSIKASARKMARKAEVHAQRIGRNIMFPRLPPPFKLPAAPRVELAILWKNAIAALRISALWIVLIAFIFAFFMAVAVMTNNSGLKIATATMAMALCVFFPFFGTQVFAQDMRLDLSRIEVLKSYPIEGYRLVAAEIAAPLAIVAVLEMIMLTVVAVFIGALPDKGPLTFVGTPEFITIVLLVTIPITGLMLLIRNAVPILLPGWASRSSEEPRGFAAMGQRIVELLAIAMTLGLALVPAALIVLPALYISRHYSAPFVLAVGTAPAALILFYELWLGIRFLGAQFEKIDVSNEIDAVS